MIGYEIGYEMGSLARVYSTAKHLWWRISSMSE